MQQVEAIGDVRARKNVKGFERIADVAEAGQPCQKVGTQKGSGFNEMISGGSRLRPSTLPRSLAREVNAAGSGFDLVRRKYIGALAEYTKRNVIVYYSGWLQKPFPQLQAVMAVNDNDKNGFMAGNLIVVDQSVLSRRRTMRTGCPVFRGRNLDLIIHNGQSSKS
jgi:hypothetical protein